LISTVAFGHKKIAAVNIEDNVAFAAVDRPGDLYVIMTNGEARKFDKNAKEIGRKKFASVPTIFDPKDGTRAFAYYRNLQAIESIAPDLSFSDLSPVHPEFAVNAWLVCPSKNEFWILDGADLSVKKTKDKGMAIAYESNFAKEGNLERITYMREYLNFLFVLDSGIHVINNLGKEISFLEGNPSFFSFLGEEIYYPLDNELFLIDLYTTDTRRIALPRKAQFALLTDERMILVDGKTIEFFEFTP
jgi:hypothetical protein